MGNALGCSLGLIPFPVKHDARHGPLFPAGGTVRLSTTRYRLRCSHHCNPLRLLNDWLCMVVPSRAVDANLPFTWSPMLIGPYTVFQLSKIRNILCKPVNSRCVQVFQYLRWESNPTAPWVRTKYQRQLDSEAYPFRELYCHNTTCRFQPRNRTSLQISYCYHTGSATLGA